MGCVAPLRLASQGKGESLMERHRRLLLSLIHPAAKQVPACTGLT